MKKRVLIIDKDPKMRQVVADILCKLGWVSLEARSAAEALKKSIEEKPDFVIMDASLPDNSKRETARLIRSDPRTAKIPIIAHSIWMV